MLTLSVSTDWPVIKTEIQNLSRLLPAFKHDFLRIANYLEQQVIILSKLEIEFRRSKKKHMLNQCESQIELINNTLQQIEQMYLMSILSN